MIRCLIVIAAICMAGNVLGASWYAYYSTTSSGGDGSIGSPWPLWEALQKTNIIAGDTLYIRGGTNKYGGLYSTLSGTANNYVTVRSYPGERAVLTDGLFGTLLTDLPNASTNQPNVPIFNSESWPAVTLSIGNEILYPVSKNGTNFTLLRGWNSSTISSHSSGDTVIPFEAPILYQSGSNVMFRDFEVTSLMTTQRNVTVAFPLSSGVSMHGKGNKLIDVVLHDTGHPGIGFWDQGSDGEVNGCLVWGVGMYDYYEYAGQVRGSGIYGQNSGGQVIVKNSIFNRQFTFGAKAFGETGPVHDWLWQTNIFFGCGQGPTESTSGSTSTSNIWYQGNFIDGSPALSYVSQSNSAQFFIGNIVVNGTLGTQEHRDSVYTNNTVLMPAGAGVGSKVTSYLSTLLSKASFNVVWDFNTYYLGAGSSQYNWAFRSSEGSTTNAVGGGNLKFQNDSGKAWKDWSGFDANTTYQEGWPTNYLTVSVMRYDYDAGRWNICVISTSGATNVTVTLSNYGFPVGNTYRIRDVQNYPTPFVTATYNGGAVNVPLNLTNIVALQGNITNAASILTNHSNIANPGLFNAFVLEDLGRVERMVGTAR